MCVTLCCSPRKVLEMYSDTWLPERLISDRWLSSRFSILLNWKEHRAEHRHKGYETHGNKWKQTHGDNGARAAFPSRGIKHFLLFSTEICPMRTRPAVCFLFFLVPYKVCLCLLGLVLSQTTRQRRSTSSLNSSRGEKKPKCANFSSAPLRLRSAGA